MTDRRKFLTLAGLAAAACAGCGTTDHPLPATGVIAMTCPAITAGSVTSQSGTLAGWAAAFVDACGDRSGIDGVSPYTSQWQYPLLISDKAGIGGRFQQNQAVKGERRLLLTLVGARLDSNSCPFPAADSGHAPGSGWNDGAGNSYQWAATFQTFSTSGCGQSDKASTGGTITITSCDASQVSGSYTGLTFKSLSGSLSGTFTAPRAAVAGMMTPEDFTGCPTRPGSLTCLNP